MPSDGPAAPCRHPPLHHSPAPRISRSMASSREPYGWPLSRLSDPPRHAGLRPLHRCRVETSPGRTSSPCRRSGRYRFCRDLVWKPHQEPACWPFHLTFIPSSTGVAAHQRRWEECLRTASAGSGMRLADDTALLYRPLEPRERRPASSRTAAFSARLSPSKWRGRPVIPNAPRELWSRPNTGAAIAAVSGSGQAHWAVSRSRSSSNPEDIASCRTPL